MTTYAVTFTAELTVEVEATDSGSALDVITGAFARDLPNDPLEGAKINLPNWRPFATDSSATIRTCEVVADVPAYAQEA